MSAPLAAAVRQALRRIPVILEEDGYSTDERLLADLRIDYADLRTAIGILFRQRRIDRCHAYLVPPPHREPVAVPGRAA